jgi:hypothetical protein
LGLSEEARQRFAHFVDQTDPSNTNPHDDLALLDFVAWALAHESDALQERFALESMMSQRRLTDDKMRYVLTILGAAAPIVAAYERERDSIAKAGPKTQPGRRTEDER